MFLESKAMISFVSTSTYIILGPHIYAQLNTKKRESLAEILKIGEERGKLHRKQDPEALLRTISLLGSLFMSHLDRDFTKGFLNDIFSFLQGEIL